MLKENCTTLCFEGLSFFSLIKTTVLYYHCTVTIGNLIVPVAYFPSFMKSDVRFYHVSGYLSHLPVLFDVRISMKLDTMYIVELLVLHHGSGD
jgi:hypothetical protein